MRLLDPDVGEIIDRESILQLKIDAGMKKGVSTQNWEEELRQLDMFMQKKIQDWQRTATGFSMDEFGRYNAELTIVNAKLWQAEDEIRALRKSGSCVDGRPVGAHAENVATLALHIADLNDVRAALVGKINRLFGVIAEEKIYA